MVSTITPHAAFKDLTAPSREDLKAELKCVDSRISTLQQVILSQTAALAALTAKVAGSEREYTLLLSETNLTIEDLTRQITALTAAHKELAARSELTERASKEKEAAYLEKLRALEEALESERRERKGANEKFAAFTKELKDAVDQSSRYAGGGISAYVASHRIISTATVNGLNKYCG